MNIKVKKVFKRIPFYLISVLLALLFTLSLINTLKGCNSYTDNVRGVQYANTISVIADSAVDLDLTNNSTSSIIVSLISDNGANLYTSVELKRGESIVAPNLSECHKPGTYSAKIKITFLDSGEEVINDVTLYVQDIDTEEV